MLILQIQTRSDARTKRTSPPQCVKGIPCGNSCISRNLTCRKVPAELSRSVQRASDRVAKTLSKPQEQPQNTKLAKLRKLDPAGADIFEGVQRYDALTPIEKTRLNRRMAQYFNFREFDPDDSNQNETLTLAAKGIRSIGEDLLLGKSDRGSADNAVMTALKPRANPAEFRDRIRVVEAEVSELGNTAEQTKQIMDFSQRHLADAIALNNGQARNLIRGLNRTRSRASANRNTGRINVGQTGERLVVFHEYGHFVEYSNPQYLSAAHGYVKARRTSDRPIALNTILKTKAYPGERAFPGDFIHPYIGKRSIDNQSTEVISSGFERFATPNAARLLLEKDPLLFAMIAGIINQ